MYILPYLLPSRPLKNIATGTQNKTQIASTAIMDVQVPWSPHPHYTHNAYNNTGGLKKKKKRQYAHDTLRSSTHQGSSTDQCDIFSYKHLKKNKIEH